MYSSLFFGTDKFIVARVWSLSKYLQVLIGIGRICKQFIVIVVVCDNGDNKMLQEGAMNTINYALSLGIR